MPQTLKIINFENTENTHSVKTEKNEVRTSFQKIPVFILFVLTLSIISTNILLPDIVLQFKNIFITSAFALLFYSVFLLGKITGNEKSYKLKILNNKKLQNDRTVEEMFYTSTIPLFQLTAEGKFQLYNSSLALLLNTKSLDEANFFNNFGISDKVKKHILQKLETKGSLENYRLWLTLQSGKEIYVNMNCKYIQCKKSSKRVIEGSLFDITHQYKKEQAIVKELENLRAEKLIAKGKQHNTAVSNNLINPETAHTLKTPISSMIGFLTLIEKGLYETEEELTGFTKSAKNSAEELLNIINNMLSEPIEEPVVKKEEPEKKLEHKTVKKSKIKKGKNRKTKSTEKIEKKKEETRQTDSKPNLLLVEDNPSNQEMERKMLEKVGYNVDVIDNGKDAIKMIKKNNYDLILMDIELKGMNGLETTKKIRKLNSEKSNIPIIAATAKSSMKDRERCLSAGMNDYISKPINITFMKMTIDQWLDKKVA